MVTLDSVVETGKVELFIPNDRNEPAQIVTDTRRESIYLPFEELYSRGHYAEAEVVAERDLVAARQAAVAIGAASDTSGIPQAAIPDRRTLIEKLQQVAMACLKNGDYERAESAANEAVEICQAAPAEHAADLVRLLHARITTRYLYRCADEESTLEFRRELADLKRGAEKLVGADHPEMARILMTEARLLISEFSYLEAEELLTRAIRIQANTLSPDHLDVSESLLELARLSAFRENNDDADEKFRQALSIREARSGPDHPDVAEVLFHYTDFLIYNQGDSAKAGSLLRRALAIWKETIGLNHSLVTRESGFIRKVLAADTESNSDLPV